MDKVKTSFKHALDKVKKAKPSFIAIAIGLFIGFLVMLIFDPIGSFQGLTILLFGPITNGFLGKVFYNAAPIILTGLALVVAFKSGLFNIGASGQMFVGGFLGLFTVVKLGLPAPLSWIIAIIFAGVAGMLWASFIGFLKAYFNTHEVVISIMMNYISMLLVIFLVKKFLIHQTFYQSVSVPTAHHLPALFGNNYMNFGIVIAILMAIIIHIIYANTTLGYELQASGFNKDASRYAGMNSKRNIILTMAISGFLAGMAGGVNYLGRGNFIALSEHVISGGFDGISVALIGLISPVGSIFGGLFLSYIRVAGESLPQAGYVSQISDMIIAVIVYLTAISAFIIKYYDIITRFIKEKVFKKKTDIEEEK